MSAFYNEIDPFAAKWLEGLIAHGNIPKGTVDRRSIVELAATDVAGPGQRHFFAGIGGWAYALRLAGVPDDVDIWTGSCPCQGLSDAGQRRGFLDPRHLWPAWLPLIEQCRPPIIFGEQVASTLGFEWLDLVFADLERCGYTVGAADLCAASVGAPHARQRLWFVAYAPGERLEGLRLQLQRWRPQPAVGERRLSEPGHVPSRGEQPDAPRGGEARSAMADARQDERRSTGAGGPEREDATVRGQGAVYDQPRSGDDSSVADAPRGGWREGLDGDETSSRRGAGPPDGGRPSASGAAWSDCAWIPCSDGVARPAEPGTHPLAHGVPGRVGLLRGYGNAIVPQVAAAFILASLESIA